MASYLYPGDMIGKLAYKSNRKKDVWDFGKKRIYTANTKDCISI